jgi:hypothetical protein
MTAVEFSLSQKAFHKSSLEEMVIRNITNTLKRIQTDYVCIGMFESEDIADKHIEGLSKGFKEYSMYKNTNGEMVVPS